jgi:hypothetical protein
LLVAPIETGILAAFAGRWHGNPARARESPKFFNKFDASRPWTAPLRRRQLVKGAPRGREQIPVVNSVNHRISRDGHSRVAALCTERGEQVAARPAPHRGPHRLAVRDGTKTLDAADKTEHRNISKGQKAMRLALLHPEPEKGGRGQNRKETLQFSKMRLSQARAVLAYSRELALAVRDGTKTLATLHLTTP